MSLETGRLTVLHLSDVHATHGELLYGAVDGLERLERVGDYALAAGITPELVVVTGDLVQRGHAGAYPALDRALSRLESALGAPVLTVLGNHDDPTAARVLRGHEAGHRRIAHVGGLRVALLDSSSGELGAEQLDWLLAQLREPAELGTIPPRCTTRRSARRCRPSPSRACATPRRCSTCSRARMRASCSPATSTTSSPRPCAASPSPWPPRSPTTRS